MGITNGQNFGSIYQDYLAWFQEKARETVSPKDPEEIIRYQIFQEDVFEDSLVLLNRMYFLIPLSPAQSRSGALESFCFSELNLMLKIHTESTEEIAGVLPVEYRRE